MGFLSWFKKKPSVSETHTGPELRALVMTDAAGTRKIHAKVIGSLRAGHLTVFVGTGIGMLDGGFATEVPIDLIPFELRMPNSEFILIHDRSNTFVGIERIPEPLFGAGAV